MMFKHWVWVVGLVSLAGGCIPNGKEPVSITLELEVPAEVRVSEAVPLQLKLKNTGKSPVKVTLGGRPAHDFIVTKPDGTEVWRLSHGGVIQDILDQKNLNPGEELVFVAEWHQQDNEGRPVPPGKYLVRGLLNLEPPKKMETEPKSLVISQ
jgi:hypothetical protein